MILPRGYRLLLKPDSVDFVTPAGIIVAVDKKLEIAGQQRCTLVAVGARCWEGHEPYAVPGDWVLISKYAGKVVADPRTEQEYLIANDEDILAVIERGDEYPVSNGVKEILDNYERAA